MAATGAEQTHLAGQTGAVVNAVACQQRSLDVGIHLLNRLARRFGPDAGGRIRAGPRARPRRGSALGPARGR